MLEQLGGDHRDWLLIASYNLLLQRKADRAATLLELLGRIDPDCLQCQRMLAYANLLLDDRSRCLELLERLRASSEELDQMVAHTLTARAEVSGQQGDALPTPDS